MLIIYRLRDIIPRSRKALEFLQSTEYQEEVQQMATEARRKGVSGVPFTIINGRWAVSGGQTSETYAQASHPSFLCPFVS